MSTNENNALVLAKTPLALRYNDVGHAHGTPEYKDACRRIDLGVEAYLDKIHAEDLTLHRFLEYYLDAGNWSGTPLVGGNVGGDASDKGFVMNMKKRGWITTFEHDRDGCVWMRLEEEGNRVLMSHGIDNSRC